MNVADIKVDIVIPVLNEEEQLEASVLALREFLLESCPYRWRIVVADNGSKDRTPQICQDLKARYPGEVGFERLEQRGRGRALKTAWLNSDADVLCYMDVDLSTNLRALPPLLAALIHSDYDLGTGSRLMHGAIVTRQWKRELISRTYNTIIRLMFWHRFRDAQCGFKGITRKAARELLLKAERQCYRIFEVPVEWIEDLGTTVKIAKTAWQDLKGLARVRLGG